MNYHLAVQEIIWLRTQPQFELRAAAAGQAADASGRDRHCKHIGAGRAVSSADTSSRRAATRRAAAGRARIRTVVGYPEFPLPEVLPVQIEIYRVRTRHERAAVRIADTPAEGRHLLIGGNVLPVVDTSERMPVGRHIRGVDPILARLEAEETIVKRHLPSDEQYLGHIEGG